MQTLSTNRILRKRPRPVARCKGGNVEQTPACTAGHPADGFLRHGFLPKYQTSPDLPEQSAVEEIYFQSVERLYRHYGLPRTDYSCYPYPYNVLLSQTSVKRQLIKSGRLRELKIEETDSGTIQLSVRESINTGSTLYYIPLEPLHKALKDSNNHIAKLLLAVCVHLHTKAGVLHYKDSESYLCYLYDIMDNWIEDDKDSMDDGDYDQQRAILDETSAVGELMQDILCDSSYLENLPSEINAFTPCNRFEVSCKKLATDAISLWTTYPNGNIYQNLLPDSEDDEENDYYGNGKIRVNEYLSFIGETSSVVYDTMMNMANDDFNERSGVQDFENTIVFDQECNPYHDRLDYEEKVIKLINDLCTLLEELP